MVQCSRCDVGGIVFGGLLPVVSAAELTTHLHCSCLSFYYQSAAAQRYPQSTTTNSGVHGVQRRTIVSIKHNNER